MEMLHDALVRELLHTYQSPEWSTEVYECVCACVAEGEMPRTNIPGPETEYHSVFECVCGRGRDAQKKHTRAEERNTTV